MNRVWRNEESLLYTDSAQLETEYFKIPSMARQATMVKSNKGGFWGVPEPHFTRLHQFDNAYVSFCGESVDGQTLVVWYAQPILKSELAVASNFSDAHYKSYPNVL